MAPTWCTWHRRICTTAHGHGGLATCRPPGQHRKAGFMDIAADKAALRARMIGLRRGLARTRDAVSARLGALLLAEMTDMPAGAVGGYAALADEVDPAPVLAALRAAGREIALPAVERRGAPLVFRRWRPGDAMRAGAFGIAEPLAGAPELVPGLLLVPLLAFDDAGYRLGYGGGYYDRTIAALRARGPLLAVGLAFAAQRVASLPREAHDMPLDLIATEAGLLRPQPLPERA